MIVCRAPVPADRIAVAAHAPHVGVLRAGTKMYHIGDDRHPLNEPYLGRRARFSPFAAPDPVPSYYGAAHPGAAIAETVLRMGRGGTPGVVTAAMLECRVLVEVETHIDLPMLELTDPTARNLPITLPELVQCEEDNYTNTAAWARLFFEVLGIRAIHWMSRQYPQYSCWVLYQDPANRVTMLSDPKIRLNNADLITRVYELAADWNVIVDGPGLPPAPSV